MESIRDGRQKIKLLALNWLGDWGLPLLIVVVGVASFGLGRLSALQEAQPAISIGQTASAAAAASIVAGGDFVASKTGEVYYYPWCAGAEKIKAANQVWFQTEAAAQSAGYRAAKNCRGLE